MPADDQAVTQAVDTATTEPEVVADTATAGTVQEPVTPDQVDDRPVQNVVAEFNRKFGRLQQQMDNLVQVYAQGANRGEAPQSTAPTDDELWTLIQQGNRVAFKEYTERIAEKKSLSHTQQVDHQRFIEAQLARLAVKYPTLNDTSHPLSQAVISTYQGLLASGHPAGRGALLEAVKTTIAERDDLMAEVYEQSQQAKTTNRQSATRRAESGVMGATTREGPSPNKPTVVTKEQAALAKRMGADPVRAMENFWKRQHDGQSSFGAVANFIKDEER